jgi:general secretion pathway protein H
MSQRVRQTGFTMIELLMVVALIALASGLASLALRDPAANQLENEGARLSALLESARAQSRASGVAVLWQAQNADKDISGFQFVGTVEDMPSGWLTEGVSAEVVGAKTVVLGPEPLIGAQRIVLHLGDRTLALATDGLGPFAVADTDTESSQ